MPRPDGFLELYKAYCGVTEVPEAFNRWAGIGLLAACVQDRIYVEKHAGSKLVPNLYILLLGPSGLGKGQSIGHAVRLAEPYETQLNVFWGRLSGPALADHIGKQEIAGDSQQGKATPPPDVTVNIGRVWLVAEELALSIGSGARAYDFVTFMTGLYSGSPVPFQDRTRSHGLIKIQSPAINWLAGSTRDWLMRSVSRDAVEGGFFARMLTIEAEYDFDKRIPEPEYPANMDELVDELRQRIELILRIRGPVRIGLSTAARDVCNQWYNERPKPEDMSMAPSWRRQQDMVYKLAMLFALSDWTGSYRDWIATGKQGDAPVPLVDVGHVVSAQQHVREGQRYLPELVRVASTTVKTAHTETARDFIRKQGTMQHSMLVRKMGGRGFSGKEVAEAVQDLDVAGVITVTRETNRRGGVSLAYTWKGRQAVTVSDDEPDMALEG